MPRKGLGLDDVVDAATRLVESEGVEALTLSRVARELDVKPPSLYSHIADLDTLRRHVAYRATQHLGDLMTTAVMGRAGPDAVAAVAGRVRSYAVEHPGLYQLTQQVRPDDEEYNQASLRNLEPVAAALRDYQLDGDEFIHAARMLRSAVHGFVSLEINGGFGIDVDLDASFDRMIDRLVASLAG